MDASETAKAIGEETQAEEKQAEIVMENGVLRGEIIVDNGVLAPAYTAEKAGQDPKTGRFLPGNNLGAAGRPAKSREDAVLRIMRQKIDPMQVVQTVLDLIEDSSSWRAREAGAKLYLSYMVGMPVQRSVTATTRLESILNRLGEMDDTEFGEVEQALKAK